MRRNDPEAKTLEYSSWRHMRDRCNNPANNAYHRYGGRGIFVCDKWNESYEAFLQDVGRAPTREHSIHRVNNDGGYEPSNVVWATAKEQQQARRAAQTHCKHGHERNEQNTYINPQGIYGCRACCREKMQIRRLLGLS